MKSESHGEVCPVCGEPVVLTFPEDRDGPLEGCSNPMTPAAEHNRWSLLRGLALRATALRATSSALPVRPRSLLSCIESAYREVRTVREASSAAERLLEKAPFAFPALAIASLHSGSLVFGSWNEAPDLAKVVAADRRLFRAQLRVRFGAALGGKDKLSEAGQMILPILPSRLCWNARQLAETQLPPSVRQPLFARAQLDVHLLGMAMGPRWCREPVAAHALGCMSRYLSLVDGFFERGNDASGLLKSFRDWEEYLKRTVPLDAYEDANDNS